MQLTRKTIGFLIMQEEEGERRAFLPNFIHQVERSGFDVFLEDGYGLSLGFNLDDYIDSNPNIHSIDRSEIFTKDFILILRSPHIEEFTQIGKSSCLISMLHYQTRPKRVSILENRKIQAISLDSIKNDFGSRMVENMKAVAWNGLEIAFTELEKRWPLLIRKSNSPWKVLVLGTGMVGKHAVDAATKFGKRTRNHKHIDHDGPGVIVSSVGRNFTNNVENLQKTIQQCDILVDATQRQDPSNPVIQNSLIKMLPKHAIIVDLSVDPYSLDTNPRVVKGIEGLPQGNLDKYIYYPQDEEWDNSVPEKISSTEKRTTISCYSWPGIYPVECMRHYGQQILPFIQLLAEKPYQELSKEGNVFERALFRGKLNTFLS